MRKDKEKKHFRIIKEHVMNNQKEYMIITLIFIVGIFLGVLFINQIQEPQRVEITSYLNEFIDTLKNTESLNQAQLLKTSMMQNIVLAILIWFFGTTVIGIPVVFGIILYRGFCLGYTVAVSITMLGLSKGLVFVFGALLLQNILFIPAILALGVSGFKLYKSIVKDKRKENIKIEMIRHTIFSIFMLLVMLVSSAIEIFASTNVLKWMIKYF